MSYQDQYEALLYQHEVLRSRLKIREHYLGIVVKEVYENIGQMLSLIRIKLLGMHHDHESGTQATIDSSGEMVGQTIHDLRNMCRLFYPEEDIVKAAGFHRVLEQEIRSRFPEAVYKADINTTASLVLSGEKGLIVFGMLLEVIDRISHIKGKLISAAVSCAADKLIFTIDYCGHTISKDSTKLIPGSFNLDVFERARLLGGKLQIKSTRLDYRRIKLELPLK